MARAPVKIDYLLGVSKKGSYDSRNNAAIKKLEERLRSTLLRMEREIVASDLDQLQTIIMQNLQRDLIRFMNIAVSNFLRQTFSTVGGAKRLSITDESSDLDGTGNSMIPGWKSSIVGSASIKNNQLTWPALAKSTIQRKLRTITAKAKFERTTTVERDKNGLLLGTKTTMVRTGKMVPETTVVRDKNGLVTSTSLTYRQITGERAKESQTYYFWWSGEMAREIRNALSGALFGPGEIIDPTIEFQRTDAPAVGQRGRNLGTIKVRLFRNPTNARVFQPALAAGDWTKAANDQSLLDKFLTAAVAEKLGRSKNAITDNKRPWVGPSIAYWIINRVPYVIESSIKKTVEQNKANRKNATDKASIDSR